MSLEDLTDKELSQKLASRERAFDIAFSLSSILGACGLAEIGLATATGNSYVSDVGNVFFVESAVIVQYAAFNYYSSIRYKDELKKRGEVQRVTRESYKPIKTSKKK